MEVLDGCLVEPSLAVALSPAQCDAALKALWDLERAADVAQVIALLG